MALPAQVQKQIDDAARIQEANNQQPAPQQPAQEATGDPTPQQPAADAEQQREPQPEGQRASDDFETKYKVLQGKYNAEVPRLMNQVREQSDQLNALQRQMEAVLAAPSPRDVDMSLPEDLNITSEEVDEYGEDLINLVGRRAMQVILPEFRALQARVEEIARGLQGVNSSVQMTEHEKFIHTLDTQHKEWRILNNDEGFLNWLDQADPLSGAPRKHLLADAVQSRDAGRALRFFQSYEAEHGKPAPRRPANEQPARRPETSLEAFAAPGQGRPAQPTPPAEASVWSRKEIAQFYTDVRKGVFKGREAERDTLEEDLVLAASQGRVIG